LPANNTCTDNGLGGDGSGIHVTNEDNHIEENVVIDNDLGIEVSGPNNLIIRNTARGNDTNYVIVATNKVGVIVSAPSSAAVNGSSGGAGVGTTDPWANLSY
jgi:parallel beta-helix repeat protein